jgi:hypothetical protein
MENRKNYLKIRSNLILNLLSVLEADIPVSEADLFCLVQESSDELVPIHFHEELFQLVLIRPRKVILFWAYPRYIIDEYNFCPDQRIRTHQLFGKPALGPSPPSLQTSTSYNSGFVYSRLHLN